jgi:hypothetical protein
MSDFGDYEPEDGWDRGDAIPILIDNLARRSDLLFHRNDGDSRRDKLVELQGDVDYWNDRRDAMNARDLLRLDQLIEDLAFVRSRVNG